MHLSVLRQRCAHIDLKREIALRKLAVILTLLAGATVLQAHAAPFGNLITKAANEVAKPAQQVTYNGTYGRHCPPYYHWMCYYNGPFWCAPC